MRASIAEVCDINEVVMRKRVGTTKDGRIVETQVEIDRYDLRKEFVLVKTR